MAKIVQGARVLTKRTDISTVIPTLPPNDDHTTGWLESDIYEGEVFVNVTDKRVWIRTSGTTVDDAMTEFAMLQSNGKLPLIYLPSSITGSLIYQGTWNANTNVPNIDTLKSKGYYWIVTVSGTTNLGLDEAGNILNKWGKTDWAIYDGVRWGIVDNSEETISMIASNVSYTNISYSALTNVQLALDQLLYTLPICSLTVSLIGASVLNNLVEVSSTLTSLTLNWTVNKVMSNLILSGYSLTGATLTTPPLTGTYFINTPVLLPTNTQTYTLTATDNHSNITNNVISVLFTQKVYWGVNINETITTSSEIMGLASLGGSMLSTSKASPVTIPDGSNSYIYYCYPQTYGLATFNVGGIDVNMILTTVSFVNSYGSSPEIYNVYRNLVTTAAGTSVTMNVS
jgi:hypothetical protein